jgi:uncharacterized protein
MTPSTGPFASEAMVHTVTPGRYLSQLCKHFAHKLPVVLEERSGRIEFPMGVCDAEARSDDMLRLCVTAADPASLPTLQDVVARHLARFAFRENPDIVWIRTAGV